MIIIAEDDFSNFLLQVPNFQGVQHGTQLVRLGVLAINHDDDPISGFKELVDVPFRLLPGVGNLTQIGKAVMMDWYNRVRNFASLYKIFPGSLPSQRQLMYT